MMSKNSQDQSEFSVSGCYITRFFKSFVVASRWAWAMILVLLFLGLELAAISPDLHELICPDADSPYDCCSAKQFQSGLIEEALAQVSVVLTPFSWVATGFSFDRLYQASPMFLVALSRGPPVKLVLI